MKILIAEKLRMTRVFDADGREIAVTPVKSKVSEIFEVKNIEKHGYEAVKVKTICRKRSRFTEFRGHDLSADLVGQKIVVENFETSDILNIVGKSKGKGFAGTIKRYNFAKGPASHGSNQQRRLGSIGAGYPQRVQKGQKMPGRMGGDRITVKNLKVVDIDKTNQIILVAGSIPGPVGSELLIVSSK